MRRLYIGAYLLLCTCGFGLTNEKFDQIIPPYKLEKRSSLQGIDCIYLINLKKCSQRLKRIDHLLKEHGIDYVRVEAVNGWELFRKKYRILKQKGIVVDKKGFHYGPYTPGKLGCYLSHYIIYKDAYEKGYQKIWILEDDVTFVNTTDTLIAYLSLLDVDVPDWDIFYTYRRPFLSSKHHEYYDLEPINEHFYRVKNLFQGGFSMFVSKKGIEAIFHYLATHPQKMPIDGLFYRPLQLTRIAPRENLVLHREVDNAPNKMSNTMHHLKNGW